MPNAKTKFQCYCCGAPLPLTGKIALVSTAVGGIDRVFLMRPECTVKVERPAVVVLVERAAAAVPIGHNKSTCPCVECRDYRKAEAQAR